MYANILLSVLALTSVVECQLVWDVVEDLLNGTSPDIGGDAFLNISQLVYKYGYNLEEYVVYTEDGYGLTLHRILNCKNEQTGPPVFLMHGIVESSDSWVLQGPNNSLAYMLADEGYDVWMGNARGNKHSLYHQTITNQDPKYWNFSWEEIGIYDLPAMIDFILQKTLCKRIHYIGHSQGSTNAFVLLSMKPEYNEKIKIVFSMAPEAFMGNIRSPIIQLISPAISVLTNWMTDNNLLEPASEFFNKIPSVCELLPVSCDSLMYSITGFKNKLNNSIVPVILGHMPTGSSTLQFIHYGQLVHSKRFCRFDHGYLKNIVMYGQNVPPDYDLREVIVPNVLFYSSNDWLSDPRDVEMLRNRLPHVLDSVYLEDFTHLEYQYGSDARNQIYVPIIKHIKEYEKDAIIDMIQ